MTAPNARRIVYYRGDPVPFTMTDGRTIEIHPWQAALETTHLNRDGTQQTLRTPLTGADLERALNARPRTLTLTPKETT